MISTTSMAPQENDNPCFLHSKMYDWRLSSPPFFCTATPMADASVALPIQECQYSVFLHSNPSDWNHSSPIVFFQSNMYGQCPSSSSHPKMGGPACVVPWKGGRPVSKSKTRSRDHEICSYFNLYYVNYACLISYKHMKIIVKKHSNKNSKSKRASSV